MSYLPGVVANSIDAFLSKAQKAVVSLSHFSAADSLRGTRGPDGPRSADRPDCRGIKAEAGKAEICRLAGIDRYEGQGDIRRRLRDRRLDVA